MTDPSFLRTFDRSTHYPMFKALAVHLDIADVVALTRTCKRLSKFYNDIIPLQWDIDERLRQYFQDPIAFRSQMARHNVILFGTFVLEFFHRTDIPGPGLIAAIQLNQMSSQFQDYLCRSEQYSFLKKDDGYQGWPIDGLIDATVYTKTDAATGNVRNVTILTTGPSPMNTLLHQAPITVFLSFVSWNKAYSVLPLCTNIQKKGYLLTQNLRASDYGEWTNLPRLAKHGWRIQEVMWPEDNYSNSPIRPLRRIGDKYTWIIPFNTSRVDWSKTPDMVFENTCFKILAQGPKQGLVRETNALSLVKDGYYMNYQLSTGLFTAKSLRHTYLIPVGPMQPFLRCRTDRASVMSLKMLEPAERPQRFDQILRRAFNTGQVDKHFDLPASWTYWDDEFPKWRRASELAELGGEWVLKEEIAGLFKLGSTLDEVNGRA